MLQRLLVFGLLAGAHATCLYETQKYACYESTGNETASEIATKRHLSPLKLCDWNRYELGVCELETTIPKGFHLKVPRDECVPKPGVWTCYHVEAGDNLHSIALGPRSMFRSTEKLLRFNKDILWGSEDVFEGMHLRLAVPWCIPDYENKPHTICHTVKDGDDLTLLAKTYNMTIPDLLELNNEELAGLDSVLTGMQIHVHHPCPEPPTTPFETWSPTERRFWTVHVVIPGDTLYVIGQTYKLDFNLICQLNKVDCSKFGSIITVGQVLTMPVVKTCTPVAGQQVCITVKTDDVALKQMPQTLAEVLSGSLTNSNVGVAPALGASFDCKLLCNVSYYADWQSNEFMVDFASKLWNLNKPLLADKQYNCGPDKQDPSAACSPAYCASSADTFRMVSCNRTSTGKCVGNDGCIIEPMMTIAVPFIPCIPDDAHTCFAYVDDDGDTYGDTWNW
jgi:LysM repeat protein